MILALFLISPLLFSLIHLVPFSPNFRRAAVAVLGALFFGYSYHFLVNPLPEVLCVGLWPHFAGITWVADKFSVVFLLGLSLLYFPCAWALSEESPTLNSLFHFLVAAFAGAFLTGDLFNLFVMFEVLLLSSYLIFFKVQRLSDARLFIWMNILGSILFLLSLAFIYQALGTLNFVDLAARWGQLRPEHQNQLYGMLLVVFTLKAGAFPLHAWMTASYPSLPKPLFAFLASISSKLGFYTFVRLSTILAPEAAQHWNTLVLALSVVGLIFSMGAAFLQKNERRALVYFAMAHTSLLFIAFLQGGTQGLSSTLLYFLMDFSATTALFFLLDSRSGWSCSRTIFYIFALAASGFPPLSLFWAEFSMLRAFEFDPFFSTLVLGTSFLSLLLLFRLESRRLDARESSWTLSIYFIVLLALSSFLGMTRSDLFDLPAREISNSDVYREAVVQKSQEVEQKRKGLHD